MIGVVMQAENPHTAITQWSIRERERPDRLDRWRGSLILNPSSAITAIKSARDSPEPKVTHDSPALRPDDLQRSFRAAPLSRTRIAGGQLPALNLFVADRVALGDPGESKH